MVSISTTTLAASSDVNIQGELFMSTTRCSARVGANLKRLIKESEYRTQERFSEAVDKDPRTVRRWIKDGVDSLDLIEDIAKALDVDVMALLK